MTLKSIFKTSKPDLDKSIIIIKTAKVGLSDDYHVVETRFANKNQALSVIIGPSDKWAYISDFIKVMKENDIIKSDKPEKKKTKKKRSVKDE